jgi:prepilin-type processing-associated H-X9-DG protein
MKQRNTFTKKDIIVVLICIIFLLANIAAIGEGGRKRAKRAVCLSNLYKWGQIFQAYTADNDGFFPAREYGTSAGYRKMWPYVYKPYYDDLRMRFCPTADKPELTTGTFGTWNLGFGAWNPEPIPGEGQSLTGSYGMNRYIEDAKGGSIGTDPAFWRHVEVDGASQIPILMDCMYLYYRASSFDDPPDYDGDFNDNEMQWICINRHNGFINVVFMDWSARKVGLKELWTLKHSRTFDTCGPWTKCGGVHPYYWPPWMRGFQDY